MTATLLDKFPKSILNKGTGFLSGYTHSLNPYTGCSFGCSYCYVRGMPVSLFRKEEWGTWVDIKRNAADVLRKQLRAAKRRGPVTIFMSSSTDPYQPAEYEAEITRTLLETMLDDRPDFVLVQTRSPLVTRDLELLQQLGRGVRVSMTIETDRDDIRRIFTPAAPPIAARLRALRSLTEAGIPTQAAVAPLLPSSDTFPELLLSATSRVCVDNFKLGDGSGGKRTRNLGIEKLYREHGLEDWYEPSAIDHMVGKMKRMFPEDAVYVSQKGFEP
ncbi:radical SAM protein [Paenibacillus sp. GCM10027627]|uniref:SPL family radical SAM protein n=1 Tax=unclassified Paenibacillus TaxID=185978 RepID=UPI00362725F7